MYNLAVELIESATTDEEIDVKKTEYLEYFGKYGTSAILEWEAALKLAKRNTSE